MSKGPCSKQTNGHLGEVSSSGCFCPTLSLACIRPHVLPLNAIDKNLLLERVRTGQQLETGKNDQKVLSIAEAAVSWSKDIFNVCLSFQQVTIFSSSPSFKEGFDFCSVKWGSQTLESRKMETLSCVSGPALKINPCACIKSTAKPALAPVHEIVLL